MLLRVPTKELAELSGGSVQVAGVLAVPGKLNRRVALVALVIVSWLKD